MAGWPKELDLAEGDLVAYVGPNADTYLDYFRKCRVAGKFKMGFVWGAFATTPVWLAYRKLWLWMLVIFIVGIGVPKLLPTGASGVATGIGVAMAMLGQSLVVKGAWKAAQEADEEGLQGEGRRAFLRRKGGTSPVAAIIASVLTALVVVIAIIGRLEDASSSITAPASHPASQKAPAATQGGDDPFDNIYKPQSEKKSAPPDWLRHSVE